MSRFLVFFLTNKNAFQLRSLFLIFTFLFFGLATAQVSNKRFGVGDMIDEIVYAKGSDNLTYQLPLKLNISNKSLILLYRFNDGDNVTDNADSIRYVENITSYLGKTLNNDHVYLRPYVISGSKDRLLKLTVAYHYEHSEINKKNVISNVTSGSVFSIYDTIARKNSFVKSDKLIITNYKGKILAMSPTLAGFRYNGKNMGEILDYMSKVKNPEPINQLDSAKTDIKVIPPASIPVTIKGKVMGLKNNDSKPLHPAYVSVVQEISKQETDTVSRTKTDVNGDFTLILPSENGNYKLHVFSADKTITSIVLTNKKGFEIATIDKLNDEFEYKLIPSGIIKMKEIEEEDLSNTFNNFKNSAFKEINITENISYESGKYELASNSMKLLDKMINILKSNPQIKLEVISHTDARGDDGKNLELSFKRSNSVIDYLVKKGIDRTRLKAIGKGETEIRNRCKNEVNCSNEEHSFNRRTEFHFMK